MNWKTIGALLFLLPSVALAQTPGDTFGGGGTAGGGGAVDTITGTADIVVTGGAANKTIALGPTTVSAGTCTNCEIDVDANGRVTRQATGTGGSGGGATTETSGVVHPTTTPTTTDFAVGGTDATAKFFFDSSAGVLTINEPGGGITVLPSLTLGSGIVLSEAGNHSGSETFTLKVADSANLASDLTCTIDASGVWTGACPSGSGGGGYATVEDEGGALTQQTTIDFIGDAVSCVDAGTKTNCTITAANLWPAGGGFYGILTDPLINALPSSAHYVVVDQIQADPNGFVTKQTAIPNTESCSGPPGYTCQDEWAISSTGTYDITITLTRDSTSVLNFCNFTIWEGNSNDLFAVYPSLGNTGTSGGGGPVYNTTNLTQSTTSISVSLSAGQTLGLFRGSNMAGGGCSWQSTVDGVAYISIVKQ